MRARVTTTKKLNLEQLTKELGVAVMASGELDRDNVLKVVMAEVPQEQLNAVIAAYEYNERYSGADDPQYPLEPVPVDLTGTDAIPEADATDKRARVRTKKAVNPELLTKLLGAPVSTSGPYDVEGEETEVVAEAPVTQAQLALALKDYKHDVKYRGIEDPNYPLKPNPVDR